MSAAIAILIFKQSYGDGKASERCSSPDAYFDDKKNPFSEFRFSHNFYVNQSGVYHIITAFNPIMQQFNVTRQKLYGVTNNVIDITHSYTYNDSGYPIAGDQIEGIGYECE